MVAARRRSKKRFATSGGAQPHSSLTFFIDECLGRKAVPSALRNAGHRTVLHIEQFPQGISDSDWLTALRAHRDAWIVLTKDKNIRKNSLERMAYITSGMRVFALASGDRSSQDQADAFLRGLRKIGRIAQLAGPYIARVTASGDVKIIERPKPGRRKKHRMEAP